MADTQRTRSAILTLFADNVTGQISAQDLRDFAVTVMNSEFVNEGDFWVGPNEQYLTTDKTTRGFHLYSQMAASNLSLSFGKIYNLNGSNAWSTANVSASTNNYRLGVATDSYASGASNVKMLICGVVYDSGMSTRVASAVGYPLFLQSELDGSISITITTNSTKRIGTVLPSGGTAHSVASGSGKWLFDPEWAVKG